MGEPKESVQWPRLHVNFSDLLIELFGCLIPGFIFLFLLFVTLMIPTLIITELYDFTLKSRLDTLMGSFTPLLIPFVIFLSYTVGHFFYRLDPKQPDKASYWMNRHVLNNTGPFREGVNLQRFHSRQTSQKKATKKVGKRNGNNSQTYRQYKKALSVEFPYSHLREYLSDRNFTDLSKKILWNRNDFGICSDQTKGKSNQSLKKNDSGMEQTDSRSKHFINALKIKIAIVSPIAYSPIARNEAHIRLMSSVWHMCKLSIKILLIVMGIITLKLGFLILISDRTVSSVFTSNHILLLAIFPLLLASYFHALKKITKFFHYQRIREIIYVLETASFLEQTSDNDIIFFNEPTQNIMEAHQNN